MECLVRVTVVGYIPKTDFETICTLPILVSSTSSTFHAKTCGQPFPSLPSQFSFPP